MYAIIVTGGKQYKVQNGDVVFVEKLDVEADAEITFDKVLAVGSEDGLKAGAPYVDGATVVATKEGNGTIAKVEMYAMNGTNKVVVAQTGDFALAEKLSVVVASSDILTGSYTVSVGSYANGSISNLVCADGQFTATSYQTVTVE